MCGRVEVLMLHLFLMVASDNLQNYDLCAPFFLRRMAGDEVTNNLYLQCASFRCLR